MASPLGAAKKKDQFRNPLFPDIIPIGPTTATLWSCGFFQRCLGNERHDWVFPKNMIGESETLTKVIDVQHAMVGREET